MAKSKKVKSNDLVKASFNLHPDLPWQLRYISTMDQTTQTEIVNSLLVEYVEKWEKKNGPIPKK